MKQEITKVKNYKWEYAKKEMAKSKHVYILFIPVAIFFILFYYIPMYGLIIAFKDYMPSKGFLGSEWVGLKHFTSFFNGVYFWKIIWNTLYLNILNIIFAFPLPIILALLINEARSKKFKSLVQTVSYLPHFISLVVIVGILIEFTATNGPINNIVSYFTGNRINFISDPKWFRIVYVGSGLWQETGWCSIIYIAALSGINPELYEAAVMDGASRLRKIWNITIPGIMPTIIITLIMSMGYMLSVGFEKIFLLQNPLNSEVSEVISSYVYKRGLMDGNYSFSTAVGLFNAVVNFIILLTVNKFAKTVSETSLW